MPRTRGTNVCRMVGIRVRAMASPMDTIYGCQVAGRLRKPTVGCTKGLMLEVMFEIRPAIGSFEIKSWDTGYFPRPKHKHLARNTPLHREMCKFTTWHDSWFYILFSSSLSPANSSGGWGRRFFGKFGSSLAVGGVESELNTRKTSLKVNMDKWYALLASPGPASASTTSSGEAFVSWQKDGTMGSCWMGKVGPQHMSFFMFPRGGLRMLNS